MVSPMTLKQFTQTLEESHLRQMQTRYVHHFLYRNLNPIHEAQEENVIYPILSPPRRPGL